mmetsp:Transcript_18207/g.23989  ORF Transcript_18207/g.23989 Transcript_18207/m.23989 type:complete len:320 (-) Transcript_18207:148-1107(-)
MIFPSYSEIYIIFPFFSILSFCQMLLFFNPKSSHCIRKKKFMPQKLQLAGICYQRMPESTFWVLRMVQNDEDNSNKGEVENVPRLPSSTDDQIFQASRCVARAFEDGKTRQLLQIQLPLIGATELDDWPGGIKQQYQACQPLVRSLLRKMADPEDKPKVLSQVIDDVDAVGVLQLQCNDAKDDKLAVIFPNTDNFQTVKKYADSAGERLAMLVNPQWKTVGDFGFFGRRNAEDFLQDFEISYHLQSYLVNGRSARLLRRYPDPWQLFAIDEKTGENTILTSFEVKPSYQEIEQAIDEKLGRLSVAERIQQSAGFLKDNL